MSKTKIVEIIESLSDGGAQSIVKDYACLINKDEFEIVIYTIYPCEYSANYRQVVDAGVKVLSVYERYGLISKVLNRLYKRKYIVKRLRNFLMDYQPDAIHVHSVMLDYLNAASVVLGECNMFYTCHSLPKRYFGQGHEVEFEAATNLIKSHKLRFVALHNEMKEELNKMFNVNNTIVLKNGVNFNRFDAVKESKKEIRRSIGVPEDSFVIGHVGRFADMKNHTFLIDVFNNIVKKDSSAHLLLVGDGELLGQIKQKVADLTLTDKVTFLSHRTDIPQLMKAMDVFVFPSIYEGLPVSIVEAQIAGIRTITSDSVTSECFYKPTLVPLSLSLGVDKWADAILDTSITSEYNRDINEFNMAEVVRRLEQMYKS